MIRNYTSLHFHNNYVKLQNFVINYCMVLFAVVVVVFTLIMSLICALITGPRIPNSIFLCLCSALSLNDSSVYWVKTAFLYFFPIRSAPCFKYVDRKFLCEKKHEIYKRI